MVLAPMADVTDCAFRKIINKYGKPDVFWTEFVSADGLAHPDARAKLLIDLKFEKGEHPIVAQIFGSNPDNIREAARLCRELGFDGVDINMGCPDRSIEKQGAGAAMIKNPKLAREIIRAAKEGAGDLPVSVKTRIGYNKNEINTWLRELLEEDIPVLTVHLRTRKEMSLVPAHWDLMRDVVALRNEMGKETLILGNGDAIDIPDAQIKVWDSGCDGVMLGRAIFGNPWLFSREGSNFSERQVGDSERSEAKNTTFSANDKITARLNVMIEHTKTFEELLGGVKNFAIMKKHYKAYVNGFDGAKELRMKLMEAENATEVEKITNDFLDKIW